VVIIHASAQIRPGGALPGESCNDIPSLRVWGDGRVVYPYHEGSRRVVLSGHLGPARIRAILQYLKDRGFFGPRTPIPPAPSGTGYDISVNLRAGAFHSYEYLARNDDTTLYRQLLRAVDPTTLTPFAPGRALLVSGPYYYHPSGRQPVDQLPEWPARFGLSLAEGEQGDGHWIAGDALAYLWQEINGRGNPYVGFREGGQAYAVALQVPGVSAHEPPFDCGLRPPTNSTARPSPTLSTGSAQPTLAAPRVTPTAHPYPAPDTGVRAPSPARQRPITASSSTSTCSPNFLLPTPSPCISVPLAKGSRDRRSQESRHVRWPSHL
jgi:hypothetical protein